jgi:hypothetical protein
MCVLTGGFMGALRGRHASESWHPGFLRNHRIPAPAGMTVD